METIAELKMDKVMREPKVSHLQTVATTKREKDVKARAKKRAKDKLIALERADGNDGEIKLPDAWRNGTTTHFVNKDGSWNLKNITVKQVLSNKDRLPEPLGGQIAHKAMGDDGNRLAFTDTLLKLGRARPKPTTEHELTERLYEYFAVCENQKMPPTYPLFAVWCGMSIEEMEKVHARVHGLKNAVALCRETIRGFLELSAMDDALSPLIYFHQQKVYFGAVETAKIQVEEVQTSAEKLEEISALVESLKPMEVECEVYDA